MPIKRDAFRKLSIYTDVHLFMLVYFILLHRSSYELYILYKLNFENISLRECLSLFIVLLVVWEKSNKRFALRYC